MADTQRLRFFYLSIIAIVAVVVIIGILLLAGSALAAEIKIEGSGIAPGATWTQHWRTSTSCWS